MNHGNTVCMVGIGGMPCRVSTSTIKDALCEELCNYHHSKTKDLPKSSKKLEDKCAKNPKWAQSGISFTKHFNGGKTIPDAVHEVGGKPVQCFDFKRCGRGPTGKPWKDSFRKGQKKAQKKLAGGNPVIEISCKTCTKCTKPCKCPK